MYVNYIDNLINTISSMSEDDYKYFEETAYEYHKKHLANVKLRRADFKIQLEKFLDGETSKISFYNLNSYLYALDQMYSDGAFNSLLSSGVKQKPITWRELFLRITTDIHLPKNLSWKVLDYGNLKIIKSIVQKLIKVCSHSNIGEMHRRLYIVNEFLDITLKEKKDDEI